MPLSQKTNNQRAAQWDKAEGVTQCMALFQPMCVRAVTPTRLVMCACINHVSDKLGIWHYAFKELLLDLERFGLGSRKHTLLALEERLIIQARRWLESHNYGIYCDMPLFQLTAVTEHQLFVATGYTINIVVNPMHFGLCLNVCRDVARLHCNASKHAKRKLREEGKWQTYAMKEIIGNPYRLTTLGEWSQDDLVQTMAVTMLLKRDFKDMPILADALEDAGCSNETILEHCRQKEHLPGCWVLRALTKKSTDRLRSGRDFAEY